MKLEDHLSAYLQKNGLSQRALAKILGVSDMTISRIESGQNFRITNAIYEALIKIISPSDILNLEETSPAVRRLKHLARESQSDSDFRLTALDAPPLDPDLLDSTVQSLQYIEFDSIIDEFIDEHFDHAYTLCF